MEITIATANFPFTSLLKQLEAATETHLEAPDTKKLIGEIAAYVWNSPLNRYHVEPEEEIFLIAYGKFRQDGERCKSLGNAFGHYVVDVITSPIKYLQEKQQHQEEVEEEEADDNR